MDITVFGHKIPFEGSRPMWRGHVKDHYIEIRFKDANGETPTWEGVLHSHKDERFQPVMLTVRRTGPRECAEALEELVRRIREFARAIEPPSADDGA